MYCRAIAFSSCGGLAEISFTWRLWVTMNLVEEDHEFEPIWKECESYTMASRDRGLALFRAVRYIIINDIPGDIVECGVWRGGSSLIVMRTLLHFGKADRQLWLFDTYSGMTEPSSIDIDMYGKSARELMIDAEVNKETNIVWAIATLDEVVENVRLTGYDNSLVHYVVGDVRKTVKETSVEKIALLRLDTDFYDSTLAELEAYYPNLQPSGVLIIDDYGHWEGARRAVDEYFETRRVSGTGYPFFNRIDYTGRIAIKPFDREFPTDHKYDYYSPSLLRANLIRKFPTLVERDVRPINWSYLRKESPHIWRTDSRSHALPDTGVLSLEEAELIYNNALRFVGRRALEIGCHYAWSTAHIVAAGLHVDVIEPALANADQYAEVSKSLSAIEGTGSFNLCAGFSPTVIRAFKGNVRWSFVFIDGYHEGDAPRLDAIEAEMNCAETACVMFHDLTSPFVAAGLRYFRDAGWKTGLYNTMQIIGIAWRGDFQPVEHIADRRTPTS